MTGLPPQLYPESLITTIVNAPEPICVVLGGPHMGISTMLTTASTKKRPDRSVSALTDPDAARDAIVEWSEKKLRSIFVDNVEHIIIELHVQRALVAATEAKHGHAVLSGFFSINRVREESKKASDHAVRRGTPGGLSISDLWWQKSRICHLNPWGYPNQRKTWDQRQVELVEGALQGEFEALSHRSGDHRSSWKSAKKSLPVWAKAVVSASGGHPALVGRGCQIVVGWVLAPPPPDDPEATLAAQLKSEASDIFLKAAQAVHHWASEGFSTLLDMARNPDFAPGMLPDGDLVRAGGLAREVERNGATVWELVHEQVAPALLYVADRAGMTAPPMPRRPLTPAVGPPDGRLRVRIRQSERDPDAFGQIERADDGTTVLVLKRTQWLLLRRIAERRGAPITVAELAGAIDKGETAVTPGMQRLREKLQKAGLGDLVYNVDGAGYAIDMKRLG